MDFADWWIASQKNWLSHFSFDFCFLFTHKKKKLLLIAHLWLFFFFWSYRNGINSLLLSALRGFFTHFKTHIKSSGRMILAVAAVKFEYSWSEGSKHAHIQRIFFVIFNLITKHSGSLRKKKCVEWDNSSF